MWRLIILNTETIYNESEFFHDLEEKLKDGKSPLTAKKELYEKYNDLTYTCIRSRVDRYIKRNSGILDVTEEDVQNSDTPTNANYVEYKSDGSVAFDRIIALQKGQDLTPVNILTAHGLDPSKWEIISCKNNYWQQQKKGGQLLTLYQSKITAKPIKDAVSIEDIKKHFNELQCKYTPRVSKYTKSKNRHYLYEVNIADLHLGKLAFEEETGEAYNTEIAKERFFKVIDDECERLDKIKDEIDQIIFVWTNDFFNSDGISGSTTGGTPQDNDTKWTKLFLTGCEILVTALDILSQYAPVKTFYIASNHSRQVDFYATCYLEAWFRNNKNVEIDVNLKPRYYLHYGTNLLGFAHSYYEKKQNLPHLMSVECSKEWGSSTYREYHLAHYHSEKVEENGGVIFRWLPSVTGADSWHSDCGYVGAVKRSYSFLYDKNLGLVQINCTII